MQDGSDTPPGAVVAPLLLLAGCSGQQNLTGSCSQRGCAAMPCAGDTGCTAMPCARDIGYGVKETQGRRAGAPGGKAITACVGPLAEDCFLIAGIWK